MQYLIIIISAILVNNIVLAQFLGICPFLGVSKNSTTAIGMAAAVAFVMTLSTIVTYLIQHYILDPLHVSYLQTISFILVIAALVQLVEIILKKVSPALYQALGVYLNKSTDHHQLYYPRRGHSYHYQAVQPDRGSRFRHFNSLWFWAGIADLCPYPRTDGVFEHPRRVKRHPDRPDYSRDIGHGIYGVFGNRIKIV